MGIKNVVTYFRNIWGYESGQFTTRNPELGAFVSYGNPTSSGKMVGPSSPMDHANYLAAIKAKVMISSIMPLQVFEETTEKKEGGKEGEEKTVKKKAPNSDLQRLLDFPNDYTSGTSFRIAMQYQAEKYGNAYAELLRGGNGKVAEMHVLYSPNMTMKTNDNGRGFYYEYQTNGKTVTYQPSQIFHLKGLSEDSITGLKPYVQAAETIGNALATNEHATTFFKNHASVNGVYEIPVGVPDTEANDFIKSFREEYAGSKNANKSLFLKGGVKKLPDGYNPEQSQLTEIKEQNAYEMVSIAGVPAHLCGLMARATFSNIEQQHQEFVDFVLMPIAKMWEDEIVLKLVGRKNYSTYAKMNFGALLRGDAATRGAFLGAMVQNGIYTPNEGRAYEDKEPLEGGDELLVNGTLTPLKQALKPPEPPVVNPPASDPAAEKKPEDKEPEDPTTPVLKDK